MGNALPNRAQAANCLLPVYPWYAIRTRSNHENLAAIGLQAKGYEVYCPTLRMRRRWTDRVVESDKPLFPGYVFCRFDRLQRLPVMTTPGVASIIAFGHDPIPVPESEIDAIQTILRSGLPTEPCSLLREGQVIRIARGSLQGLSGILMKKKSEWRLVVSVTLLQRSIAVEIDRDWIVVE
jgi:transcription antitermination factor NusG